MQDFLLVLMWPIFGRFVIVFLAYLVVSPYKNAKMSRVRQTVRLGQLSDIFFLQFLGSQQYMSHFMYGSTKMYYFLSILYGRGPAYCTAEGQHTVRRELHFGTFFLHFLGDL